MVKMIRGMSKNEMDQMWTERSEKAARQTPQASSSSSSASSTTADGPLATQEIVQIMARGEGIEDYEALYRCPPGVDQGVWLFEHMRQFTLELNQLTVSLHEICYKEICPLMKATDEWLFLCAAHKKPQECSAIDYIVHTLDGTAALLNSNKWFPSRMSIPDSSLAYFNSIARRLYRIFSHAFFHHREAFDLFENETHLCKRFAVFSRVQDLIPEKLLLIPFNQL